MAPPVLRKLSLVKPQEEAGKAWPAIVVGAFVAFGGVLFGYVTQSKYHRLYIYSDLN